MLLAAPYQTIEIANISVLPYNTDKKERTVAPIHYIKSGLIMQGFTILSPPLIVTSYDASLNRLQLNTTNNRGFANKIMAIQDYFSQTDSNLTFQRLCSPTSLTLYLFPSTPVHHSSETNTITNVKPGDTIRCVIRLHNLFRIGQVLRLQHSVPIIYGVNV